MQGYHRHVLNASKFVPTHVVPDMVVRTPNVSTEGASSGFTIPKSPIIGIKDGRAQDTQVKDIPVKETQVEETHVFKDTKSVSATPRSRRRRIRRKQRRRNQE